jgi:tetratricopeptide (TPR) repeat protein
VQWKAEQQSYATHKLVHEWGCDRLTAAERSKYSRAAFGLVVEAVEVVEGYSRGPEHKLRLVPHIMESFEALAGTGSSLNKITEAQINEMEGIGRFVIALGRWPEARTVTDYVLQASSRLFGEEHMDTILAMNNVAITRVEQGLLKEAAVIQEKVLEKRKRIGEKHPDTFSAMKNLAVTLGQQGHLEEAAAMKREVLEKMKRIFGEEHSDTISAISSLANALIDQGHLEEVAAMKKEVLEKRKRILGDKHIDTIRAMIDFEIILREQEKLY